jgi:hypothetical protein
MGCSHVRAQVSLLTRTRAHSTYELSRAKRRRRDPRDGKGGKQKAVDRRQWAASGPLNVVDHQLWAVGCKLSAPKGWKIAACG